MMNVFCEKNAEQTSPTLLWYVQPWYSREHNWKEKDDTVKLCLASMAPALHCQGTSRSLSPVQAWKCRCYFVQSPEKRTRNRFFKSRCSTFAPWTMVLCRRWAKITLTRSKPAPQHFSAPPRQHHHPPHLPVHCVPHLEACDLQVHTIHTSEESTFSQANWS